MEYHGKSVAIPVVFTQEELNNERWVDIQGLEGYQISDLGRMRSLDRTITYSNGREVYYEGKLLTYATSCRRYYRETISVNGTKFYVAPHRLVYEHFIGEIPKDKVTNHKNFNRYDNRVGNLEVITQLKNADKKHIKSSSKYTNVTWDKRYGKWSTFIHYDNRRVFLGRFTDEDVAGDMIEQSTKFTLKYPEVKLTNKEIREYTKLQLQIDL